MIKGKFFLPVIGLVLWLSCSCLFGEEIESEVVPFTLKKAVEIALDNNTDILIKKQELKESAAGIKEARSGLFPRLDAGADYYAYHDHPYITYENSCQINVSLTQTLYAGGQLINSFRQAELNLEAAGERQRRVRQEVIFKVEKAFYDILLAEEFVRINRDALSLAEEQLRIAEERYDAGEVSNYDVLRAEVEVAGVKPELVKAENCLETAQNMFKFILGLGMGTPVKLNGEFAYFPREVDLDDALDAALIERPELKEIEFGEGMAQLGIKIARGGRKPSVFLSVGTYWDDQSAFSVRDEWDDYYVGLVSVSIPVFDSMEAGARTEKAFSRLEAVRIYRENFGERVKLEVENAFLSLKAAEEVVVSQVKNVDRALEALEIMQARYKSGKAAQLDLLDAQIALSGARVSYAQSIYDHILAGAKLKLAMGVEEYEYSGICDADGGFCR